MQFITACFQEIIKKHVLKIRPQKLWTLQVKYVKPRTVKSTDFISSVRKVPLTVLYFSQFSRMSILITRLNSEIDVVTKIYFLAKYKMELVLKEIWNQFVRTVSSLLSRSLSMNFGPIHSIMLQSELNNSHHYLGSRQTSLVCFEK